MKKKKIIILSLLISILIGVCGIGTKIAIDRENKDICDTFSEKYDNGNPVKRIAAKFGRYNGYVAVFFGYGNDCAMNIYNIEHLHFIFTTSHATIYLYKKGEMYELPVAYDMGLINLKQVAKIQLRYNKYFNMRNIGLPKDYYITK